MLMRMSKAVFVVMVAVFSVFPRSSDAQEPQDAGLSALVKERSINDTIMLTICTDGYLDFLHNMVCRLNQLEISQYVVGAVDDGTMAFCQKHDIPAFSLQNLNHYVPNGTFALFNTMEFRMIVRQKQIAQVALLNMGYTVFVMDLDVFFLRNPLGYLSSLPDNDFIIQSGSRTYLKPFQWINAGCMLVNPTAPSFESLMLVMNKTSNGLMREGQAFNEVLCGLGKYGVDWSSCWQPTARAKVLILDRTLFMGGDVFFADFVPEIALQAHPYAVHFTHFRYEAKKRVMKEMGMWVGGEIDTLSCTPFSIASKYNKSLINGLLRPSRGSRESVQIAKDELVREVLWGTQSIWMSFLGGCCLFCVVLNRIRKQKSRTQ